MTLRPRAFLLLVLLGLPLALSLAACNKVQTLSIIPGFGIEVLTAAGQTAQYTAFAQEQMGSGPTTTANVTNSVTWSTSNPNIATINSSGLATAVGAGYAEITAVASDGAVASSDLTVESTGTTTQSTPSITILPSTAAETFVGETTQFTATGNLTGIGNSQDLTSQVQWLSSNAQVATVNSFGLVTAGANSGTTTIIAEYGGLTASATVSVTISGTGTTTGVPSLTVTPGSSSETFAGETTQFLATGNLTGNGGLQNLTNQVTWFSSNQQVAGISATGLATAVGAGTTTIVAIAPTSGLNASASLTVTISSTGTGTPTLVITPNSETETFTGETTQFFATGNLTGVGSSQNLTDQVTWSSSNAQVATIVASGATAGLATATGYGSTLITAQSGAVSTTAILTVTNTATTPQTPTLNIIPGAQTFMGPGGTAQLLAIGNLAGNAQVQNLTNTVTWMSSSPGVVSVSPTGLLTSHADPPFSLTDSTTVTAIGQTTTGNVSVITSSILVTVTSQYLTATPVPEPVLTVTLLGTQNGSVTGMSGTTQVINCGNGGATCSGQVAVGTPVTLTETPNAGSTFGAWSGNCTVASPTSCTIIVSNDVTVTAKFN
jgi:hypothetical protein